MVVSGLSGSNGQDGTICRHFDDNESISISRYVKFCNFSCVGLPIDIILYIDAGGDRAFEPSDVASDQPAAART